MANTKRALIIGAGIGLAPLIYLNKTLKEKGVETKLICGFKHKGEVIEGCDYIRLGGTIIDDIEPNIESFKPDMIYCCAPQIVLKLSTDIANKHKIPIQVAMEKTMACSIGVCRGCVIKVKTPYGIKNQSICQDGPVFYGSDVIWE